MSIDFVDKIKEFCFYLIFRVFKTYIAGNYCINLFNVCIIMSMSNEM